HLLARLEAGESIALITDGGLPVISDPGFPLIRGCYAAGIPVCVIPGATAGMAALAISGIPARRAGFEGFLPTKKGRRAAILENYANDERAIIIYESPHRLIATLTELHAHLGDRQAAAARELTKKFEEIRQGSLTDLIQHFQQTPPKGEFVLIISGKSKS
ncbi:MAG: rRNA small subunit methyltransferase 1, partial [Defluviitaleaceae bacterium]|nr:rRNA small subunit methyltransferase 1 [Defluviitaleaceae bacterium]